MLEGRGDPLHRTHHSRLPTCLLETLGDHLQMRRQVEQSRAGFLPHSLGNQSRRDKQPPAVEPNDSSYPDGRWAVWANQ